MIDNIITLLKQREFKGESELIDIAKGKYKIPTEAKEVYKQFKRNISWLSKKQLK